MSIKNKLVKIYRKKNGKNTTKNIADSVVASPEPIKGYYINLDKRVDRKVKIEELIKHRPFFSKLNRFSAVENQNGALGCCRSHIEVLYRLKEFDDHLFMIIEDDLQIFDSNVFNAFLRDFEIMVDQDWDVLLFTPFSKNLIKEPFCKNFYRVQNCQTTTGYIVKKKYIDNLIDNFEESQSNMENGNSKRQWAIDINWKKLQMVDKFVCYHKNFATQYASHSDIEGLMKNYVFLKWSLK